MELITSIDDKRVEFQTLCPECGPRVLVDCEGCCKTCGSQATGDGVNLVMLSLRTSLRKNASLNEALKEASKWIVGQMVPSQAESAMRAINAILYPDRRRDEALKGRRE